MGTYPGHEFLTTRSYEAALELLITGARNRGGNGWAASSSAVFGLGNCTIVAEIEPATQGARVRYRLDDDCASFAPFAERELRSIFEEPQRKQWITLGAISLAMLLAAAWLARGA